MPSVVLRFSSLGDIVLTSAFVNAVEGELFYVTGESFKEFVQEYFPHKQMKVFGIPKINGLFSWFQQGRQFARVLSTLTQKDSIDVFDLHNVTKSRLFILGMWIESQFSKRTPQFEFKFSPKFRLQRMLRLYLKLRNHFLSDYPVFKRHLSLLDDSSKDNHKPTLLKKGRQDLFRTGDTQLKVLLAPDAQHWKKKWPTENWKSFLTQISKITSIQVHLTIVGNQPLLQGVQEIFKGTSHQVRDLQGQTSLLELPQVASEHQICLCGNSAWLHISEAVGTPVLTLPGPIVPEFGFYPWHSKSEQLTQNLWCKPCTLHGDGVCVNFDKHRCMKFYDGSDLHMKLWNMLGYRSAPQ